MAVKYMKSGQLLTGGCPTHLVFFPSLFFSLLFSAYNIRLMIIGI